MKSRPDVVQRKCAFSTCICLLILAIMHVGYSDEMLELVVFALEDLRQFLKEKGSNLMFRFGNAESVLQELVTKVLMCSH